MFIRVFAAILSGAAFLLLSLAGGVQAAEKAPPAALLWVGNSFFYYNNSMHNFVLGFARADGRTDTVAAYKPVSLATGAK